MTDLHTPNKFGHEGSRDERRRAEESPERIASILKQSSPLRMKLATESLQKRSVSPMTSNDFAGP